VQREGVHFVENAVTRVLAQALYRVVFDYLMLHPPCFLDEPFEITDCLSYCDRRYHRGTIYRAANFVLVRENERGIQTYRRPLRRLMPHERRAIMVAASCSLRSRRYRATRAASMWKQGTLFEYGRDTLSELEAIVQTGESVQPVRKEWRQ
jgi:hypothetical protein